MRRTDTNPPEPEEQRERRELRAALEKLSSACAAPLSDHELDLLGVLSRKSRWRLRRAGRFPEPRRVGGRLLWPAEEVARWLGDPEGWRPTSREEAAAA